MPFRKEAKIFNRIDAVSRLLMDAWEVISLPRGGYTQKEGETAKQDFTQLMIISQRKILYVMGMQNS